MTIMSKRSLLPKHVVDRGKPHVQPEGAGARDIGVREIDAHRRRHASNRRAMRGTFRRRNRAQGAAPDFRAEQDAVQRAPFPTRVRMIGGEARHPFVEGHTARPHRVGEDERAGAALAHFVVRQARQNQGAPRRNPRRAARRICSAQYVAVGRLWPAQTGQSRMSPFAGRATYYSLAESGHDYCSALWLLGASLRRCSRGGCGASRRPCRSPPCGRSGGPSSPGRRRLRRP